jgi:protein-S-isoprenylcysteine O-methyltransferase Ste14
MGQGIGEVLTFAVGVAISPVPIIAVILMLFSARAKVNGPMFLLGWVVALAVVSFAVYYFASDASDPSTNSGASDAISWGKVVLGTLLLVLALRSWRNRPAPGELPDMPLA